MAAIADSPTIVTTKNTGAGNSSSKTRAEIIAVIIAKTNPPDKAALNKALPLIF